MKPEITHSTFVFPKSLTIRAISKKPYFFVYFCFYIDLCDWILQSQKRISSGISVSITNSYRHRKIGQLKTYRSCCSLQYQAVYSYSWSKPSWFSVNWWRSWQFQSQSKHWSPVGSWASYRSNWKKWRRDNYRVLWHELFVGSARST